MLVDIYSSMLSTIKTQETPKYISHCFYINKPESQTFWTSKENEKDRQVLMNEWDSLPESAYQRLFHGVTFMIKFDMKK